MTYLTFHLIFLIPPILLMAATLPRPLGGTGGLRGRLAIPLLCGIAFTYTTPWDNYLVARNVWWYGPERVLATIGYVPVEEYMFFVLQPILTGLFLYHVLGRWTSGPRDAGPTSAYVGAGLFGLVSAWGFLVLAVDWTPGTYMALILAWASPVLAGMWLYDGQTLWRYRRVLLVGVGIPTLYLWIADATAIHSGIWMISDRFTLGVDPFGLPVEEATFFLMTNLLVVKGILLFLHGSHETLPRTESALQSSDA